MSTSPSTVTIWESGRLVVAPPAPPLIDGLRREHWIGAALLLACVLVMAAYVGLLERVVNRSAMQHDGQRARAVAEGQCEQSHAADARGACLAIFDGTDAVATARDADVAPANDVYENAGRMATASLTAANGMAGIQQ